MPQFTHIPLLYEYRKAYDKLKSHVYLRSFIVEPINWILFIFSISIVNLIL